MPRTGAQVLEHEAIVAAAVVGAQVACALDGFRQRDVRFFIELFSNWLEATSGVWALDLHNAQVQRYLEELVSAGLARRKGRKPPRYLLTPDGLLRVLERLGARRNLKRVDEFFFVLHVFHAYGGRLRKLVEEAKPFASRSLAGCSSKKAARR